MLALALCFFSHRLGRLNLWPCALEVLARRRPSKARGEWRERAGYSFRTSPALLMSRRVAVLGCLSLGLLLMEIPS